jgi:hypothetical protein
LSRYHHPRELYTFPVAELAPYVRVLQVEKTLFRIPQFTLSQSKTFRERFLEPALEGTSSTDKYSLRLDGVRASEFRQLLRIILPLYVQSSNHGDVCTNMDCSDHAVSTDLNADEAMSVLKLSTLWDFPSVRHMAINSLSSFTLEDPILKIVASQMYSIHDWLVPAVNALAQREQPLTLADVSRLKVLGDADVVMDLVLKIAHVRESASTSGIASGAASKRQAYDFTPAILATFGLDTGGDQDILSGVALDKRVGTDGCPSSSDAMQQDATDQTVPPATDMSLASPELDPETALEERQPEIHAMEETLQDRGQHLSAVPERTQVLIEEVRELEERKAKLLADESEAQATLDQKRTELQAADMEVEAMRGQLAELNRSLEGTRKRQRYAEERLDSLRKEAETAHHQRTELIEAERTAHADLEERKKMLSTVEDAFAVKSVGLADLQRRYRARQERMAQLRQRRRDEEAGLAKAQDDLAAVNIELQGRLAAHHTPTRAAFIHSETKPEAMAKPDDSGDSGWAPAPTRYEVNGLD